MIMISDVREPVAVLLSETSSSSSSGSSVPVVEEAYTITDTNGYYTPWGTAPMESGLAYFKIGIGAVGVVAVFCFAVPYAIGFITDLFREFKNNFRG